MDLLKSNQVTIAQLALKGVIYAGKYLQWGKNQYIPRFPPLISSLLAIFFSDLLDTTHKTQFFFK